MATPILDVLAEATEMATQLGHTVNSDDLLLTIRRTRAKSDISVFFPDFNPGLIVTGCKARSALAFYLQLTNGLVTFNPELGPDNILPAPPAEVEVDLPPAKTKGLKKK